MVRAGSMCVAIASPHLVDGDRLGRATGHAGDIARRGHAASGPLVQPLAVAMDGVDVRQRMPDDIDNGSHDGVGERAQPVMNPQPLTTRVDQSRPAEIREVSRRFRRLRLRDPETLVDVAHADLTRQEEPQDPEAGLIGERFEERFHLM